VSPTTSVSRLTVPSRNDQQLIEVRPDRNPAPSIYYKAVPVLTQHVYRLADLVNKSEYVLLARRGRTMYVGSDFVGRNEPAASRPFGEPGTRWGSVCRPASSRFPAYS